MRTLNIIERELADVLIRAYGQIAVSGIAGARELLELVPGLTSEALDARLREQGPGKVLAGG